MKRFKIGEKISEEVDGVSLSDWFEIKKQENKWITDGVDTPTEEDIDEELIVRRARKADNSAARQYLKQLKKSDIIDIEVVKTTIMKLIKALDLD